MSTAAAELEISPRARRRARLRKRFLRRRLAVFGAVLALVFVLMALLAPLIAPYDPARNDFNAVLAPPSATYLLGGDDLGRDVLSRIIYGARASMEVGVLATVIAMVVAVPIGLVAGYYRGWTDPIISRINDVVLAFPFLILAVGLAAIFGPSLTNAALALGISRVPILVRITRGEVLALREEDYVRAAIANGAGDGVILTRHILPNMVNTLLVQATITVPLAIIGESLLSFLGLGVQPPTPSWGVMLAGAQQFLVQAPWLALFPGLAVFFATLSFNLFGDGLRDVLDPRTVS